MDTARSLDLTVLKKAITSLEKVLSQPFNEFIRDAAIQRFEYTYELCWKFIRRHLILSEGGSGIDTLTRKELFRLAADKGLIEDAEKWFTYHYGRNETSHVYNEKKADEIYHVAQLFSHDAKKLLDFLEKRYAKP